MSRVPANFVVSTQLTTSAVAIVTAPASTVRIVDSVTFTNSSTTQDATITLYHVASGGSADTSNILLRAYSIPAGTTKTPVELVNKKLSAGQTIQALASINGIINVSGGGDDYTAS